MTRSEIIERLKLIRRGCSDQTFGERFDSLIAELADELSQPGPTDRVQGLLDAIADLRKRVTALEVWEARRQGYPPDYQPATDSMPILDAQAMDSGVTRSDRLPVGGES